jgi:hypothetical protein
VTEFSRSGASAADSKAIPENDLPLNSREDMKKEITELKRIYSGLKVIKAQIIT